MRRPLPFSQIWWQERGLSATLAFLVFAIFVAVPMQEMGYLSPVPGAVLFTLLLLSGVAAISGRRRVTIFAGAVAIVTLGVRWAYFVSPGLALACWGDGLGIVSLSLVVAFLLGQVFREGPVTTDRIQGAVAVYLLLGLIWSLAYQIVDLLVPAAFRLPEGHVIQAHPIINHTLIYFSFVTLTTVGYGDITPAHPVARSLSNAEALIGLLYPAILIGRLVSLQIAGRREDASK